METLLDLNQKTIEAAQDLVRHTKGSADFYREAAGVVKSPVLERAFRNLAETRGRHSGELGSHLKLNGAEVPETANLRDRMHETWTKLRGMLNGGDNYVLLIEAERAEDRIKAAYEQLIKDTAGSALSPVLHAQFAEVKASHDEIRNTRDMFAATR